MRRVFRSVFFFSFAYSFRVDRKKVSKVALQTVTMADYKKTTWHRDLPSESKECSTTEQYLREPGHDCEKLSYIRREGSAGSRRCQGVALMLGSLPVYGCRQCNKAVYIECSANTSINIFTFKFVFMDDYFICTNGRG